MPILERAANAAKLVIDRNGPIDQTKLQKLLYYAQAVSLVWFAEPLFPEPIEAWTNGPVIADFWRQHAYESALSQVREATPILDSRKLARSNAIIDEVLRVYGSMTGAQLSEMTHNEQPWKHARGPLPAGARSNAPINLELMREFYANKWRRPASL
jgi:uncharacterized phage-associated protein